MKQTIILTTLFLSAVLTSSNLFSQSSFELPDNMKLKTPEDYEKYEGTFIEASKWLENTDLDKEEAKRKSINAFVIEYITGSPTISLTIYPKIMDLTGKNTQLLTIYMASYGRYFLESKKTAEAKDCVKAALNSMMTVYKKRHHH